MLVRWGTERFSFLELLFLFGLYAAPAAKIFIVLPISCHCHANDTQLFLSVDRNDRKLIDSLYGENLYQLTGNCIRGDFWQLNADEPEVMILGPDNVGEPIIPLMSPVISSERVTRCALVRDSVVRAERA